MSYVYCPLLGLPTFAVHALYERQHATSSPEQHRTSYLQHAAWGCMLSCSSPSPAVLLYIFLKLDSAPRQSYCCNIYIILKLPQLSWQFLLPGRRNFILVHHSVLVHQSHAPLLSCTSTLVHHQSRASLHTRAPLVHHSILMHQSRAPLLSCTNLVHHQSRAQLVLVHLSCIASYSASLHTHAPLWTIAVAGSQYSSSHCLILALS